MPIVSAIGKFKFDLVGPNPQIFLRGLPQTIHAASSKLKPYIEP